jgi:hypothetical protein
MSGVVVLGLLWAAVGILLGFRWRDERAKSPSDHASQPALEGARFGQVRLGGSHQRIESMLLAYASGALAVAVGLVVGAPWLLGLGALLVNVGTIYRYLVVALDAAQLDSPVITRTPRARHRPAASPLLRRVLIGDLAK